MQPLIDRLVGYAEQRQHALREDAVRVAEVWAWRVLRVCLTVLAASTVLFVLLFLAFLSYLALYWIVVPTIAVERPVYFDYEAQEAASGRVQPLAGVSLVSAQYHVASLAATNYPVQSAPLSRASAYNIAVELEMPPTLANLEAGMTMVSSSRPFRLPHRPWLARMMRMWALAVPLAINIWKDTEMVVIPMFESFVEDPVHQTCSISISLSSSEIQVEKARVRWTAVLSGARHWMYEYRMFMAAIGVAFVFGVEVFVILLLYVVFVFRTASAAMPVADEGVAGARGDRRNPRNPRHLAGVQEHREDGEEADGTSGSGDDSDSDDADGTRPRLAEEDAEGEEARDRLAKLDQRRSHERMRQTAARAAAAEAEMGNAHEHAASAAQELLVEERIDQVDLDEEALRRRRVAE